jgi:hypothetical protein
MMLELKTEIEINSTVERVWSILLDFPQYSQWNTFIRSVAGTPKAGERLTVLIHADGSRGMTFRPIVLLARQNRELRWLGRLFVPGIFDGEHYFQLEPLAPNHVKFIQGERFSGLLVPPAKTRLEGETRAGFIAMNQALKTRAETP